MDDHRFDDVVRSFARRRSRRAFVGSLLGGGLALLRAHLRLPGAAARQGYRVQGEPCFDDSQCIGAESLFCAYNGFGSAGAACCAAISGSCFDSAGCCSQCSGICAPRDAVCGEGQCRSGYVCPAGCSADDWRPGRQSGYCLDNGACA